MKYRKKPVIIEAVQYEPETRDMCIGFCNPRFTTIGDSGEVYEAEALFISTLEGEMRCDIGDYIIKGVKGEFYPCKPDIFEMTYEAAE